MKTALAGSGPPFAAAVAYHPGCDPPGTPLQTDTLIVIGAADDWSAAPRGVRWREQVQANGRSVQLKVYPGALHGFNGLRPPHHFAGHYAGREPAAAADALAETYAFLGARLLR